MTRVFKIDERTKAAKMLVAHIKTLPFVQFEEDENRFNEETEKAMKEARKGIGIVKSKSHSDLMIKLRS